MSRGSLAKHPDEFGRRQLRKLQTTGSSKNWESKQSDPVRQNTFGCCYPLMSSQWTITLYNPFFLDVNTVAVTGKTAFRLKWRKTWLILDVSREKESLFICLCLVIVIVICACLVQWSPALVLDLPAECSSNHNLPHLLQKSLIGWIRCISV